MLKDLSSKLKDLLSNDKEKKEFYKKILICSGIIILVIIFACCSSAVKKDKAKQELSVIIEDSINELKAEKEAEANNTEDKYRDIYTINSIEYHIDGFKKNFITDAKNAHIVIDCNIEYKGIYKKGVAEENFANDLLNKLPHDYFSDILHSKILVNAPYEMVESFSSTNYGVLINVNGKKYIESSEETKYSSSTHEKTTTIVAAGLCSHCHGAGVTKYGQECGWCNGTGYWVVTK